MRYHSYLNSAKAIIESYKGDVPLAQYLKKYFSANKKYGSKDRKQIAALCYNFYRLGKAVPQLPVEEKIIVAVFLCENKHNDFLHFHKSEWNGLISKTPEEKMQVACITGEDIFPWAEALSDGMDAERYRHAYLMQPDLFVRIRPGKTNAVTKKLRDAGIVFHLTGDGCIALPNATKIDTILDIDSEAVIQDLNSQKVLDWIKQHRGAPENPVHIWDCCAASGGKSILAYDIFEGKVQLTVSDIRESILSNLENRFEKAGIKNYRTFVADLSGENSIFNQQYSMIICDAPCTGSGTWSRTPEQLYFLKRKTIDVYVEMQQRIVSRVIPHLPQGGIFIYITCSVFKNENEDMVNFIKEKFHLQLLQMELLKGYDKKADSMFAAVFQKS